jgi:hypothetical protein
MIFFNLRGLLGMLLGGLAAWAVIGLFPVPLTTGCQLSYGLLIFALVSSLFALSTDRCDRPGLWQAYRVNCITFYNPAFGQPIPGEVGWNPERRLAVLIWPLAFGPFIMLAVALIVWAVDLFQGVHLAEQSDYVNYAMASLAAVVIAAVYASLTSTLRRLPSSRPGPSARAMSIEVPPTTHVGRIGAAIRSGSTPEAPNRWPASFLIPIGAGGLAFNYFFAFARSEVRFLVLLACPLLLTMGLGTLLDPRILWSLRAEGRIYPWSVRALGGLLALAGLAIGVLLIFVA